MAAPQNRSVGIAMVLAVIITGLGHFYLGLFGKGVIILIIGIVLGVISAFSFGIGLIAFIPFWIWQIWDARKIALAQNAQSAPYGT